MHRHLFEYGMKIYKITKASTYLGVKKEKQEKLKDV